MRKKLVHCDRLGISWNGTTINMFIIKFGIGAVVNRKLILFINGDVF